MFYYSYKNGNSGEIVGYANNKFVATFCGYNLKTEVEPVSLDGKWYLPDDNEYLQLLSEYEKNKKMDDLISQYQSDKKVLMKYILEANAYGESTDDLNEELIALDEKFDNDIRVLNAM